MRQPVLNERVEDERWDGQRFVDILPDEGIPRIPAVPHHLKVLVAQLELLRDPDLSLRGNGIDDPEFRSQRIDQFFRVLRSSLRQRFDGGEGIHDEMRLDRLLEELRLQPLGAEFDRFLDQLLLVYLPVRHHDIDQDDDLPRRQQVE